MGHELPSHCRHQLRRAALLRPAGNERARGGEAVLRLWAARRCYGYGRGDALDRVRARPGCGLTRVPCALGSDAHSRSAQVGRILRPSQPLRFGGSAAAGAAAANRGSEAAGLARARGGGLTERL